ncbi:MAG: RagB/SusD family nutrient uptake outer membrane protein, partial [Duncaniella sp.]|nr:RagB/SusD family nutrient uptake outer membrane protein [Duncaniella sp.]
MRRLYISAAVCLGLLSAGCTHYLDVKPYDRVIPKTAEDFSALLQNTLNDIDEGNSNEVIPNFSSTSTYDATYADDFEVCLTGSGGSMLSNYIGSAITYGHFDSKYNSLYATIRDCNIIMDEIVERESDEAQKVIATSLAIRGVAYYQLLKGFCAVPEPGNYSNQLGVPLVTHFDMEEVPLRSNMQQTIQLIENDLKSSIAMEMTDPLYRFTPDVCKGYLARLYFWTRQWDKALEMSQEVLKKYPLVGREEYKNMMADTYKLGASQLIKCYRSLSSSSATNSLSSTITTLKSRPVSA